MNSTEQRQDIFAPSIEQAAILKAIKQTRENILIQACAGSGKTTTLQMICNALPPGLRVLAVCFNRSAAMELNERLPKHVKARTIDSLGFEILRDSLRLEIQVKIDKPKSILDDYCKSLRYFDWGEEELTSFRRYMIPLMDRVRETMTDPDDKAAIRDLADRFGFDVPESTIEHLPVLLGINRVQRSVISFADMIDHVVYYDLSFPKYNVILVDEAQDLNLLQIEFLRRIVEGYGSRIIVVGDRHQAIYGWRGADSRSMERIREIFGCKEYPLSVCYRCSGAVVRSAQEIVGKDCIRVAENAPEGLVLYYPPERFAKTMESLIPGDMVLCRTNSPLVSPCLGLIRSGHKASILGKDTGKALIALASRISAGKTNLSKGTFLNALKAYALIQIERLEREQKAGAIFAFQDMLQALCSFVVTADIAPSELESHIVGLFSQESRGVIFSTIHRAKGLEADTVVFLAPELIPHPMSHASKELRLQEVNLDYVARTRARMILIFQPLGDP